MELSNKEAVQVLIKYFKENASLEDVYRTLANCMLDYNRMAYWSEKLPNIKTPQEIKEYLYFIARLNLNSDQVVKVINGKNHEPFVLKTLE